MIGSRLTRLLAGTWTVAAGVAACSTAPVAEPTSPPRAVASARPSTPPSLGPAPVRLDSLTASRQEPTDSNRNPFRFQPKAIAVPPRAIAPPPEAVFRPPMPTLPAGPPPPPPIPLKFIGVVQRANGVKWAVLSDGKLTLYGREADIIDGQYRIVSIGADSIELAYADGRGRQRLRLTGQ